MNQCVLIWYHELDEKISVCLHATVWVKQATAAMINNLTFIHMFPGILYSRKQLKQTNKQRNKQKQQTN